MAAVAAVLLLAGCSSNDSLAQQYSEGSGQGYISGDGAYTEIPADQRDEPIVFEGTDERGETISSEQLAGTPYVVNFWYASCPPCRVEAPDLADLSLEYADVPFVGVNISDSADVALTFADEFGVPYPSIMDAQTAGVQLAFAGSVAPNAVPTTIVVDAEGRVAARISGLLREPGILASMIDTVLAEGTR
ncbi:thiol-disulfide isomerase/thioredoxin [Microbacteriaceae bacterium SG_E_30_P1]|uniref:Thiol-disulfide isomerase/thioredoxin n=1 Tax=Antiquaquibacter oligotrophicus TaxID=2880260 RepID=A0ABT6KS40_9MICO|nr:TlpA disulfide reductase family protein [Antiquaquibacter oligotrophicus]MDH6182027.1 thiol-disulfide isomerase/thioredoxin [Antiquaquibacter oligotrophicus]UDF12305.1 TlpA family protein disulfide reductase [Antiquaquibacter oligotrophicus]